MYGNRKMDDNLNFIQLGRDIFYKWLTASFFVNGRQPKFFGLWKMTRTKIQMEFDIIIFVNGRNTCDNGFVKYK